MSLHQNASQGFYSQKKHGFSGENMFQIQKGLKKYKNAGTGSFINSYGLVTVPRAPDSSIGCKIV